ncbi:MAG: MerR family transcriptional regulator [Planctomycetota bacterium]|nr:MerR family transcriptional regulator [Planctomycetota bacterium]
MRIGEFARLADTNLRTLRYYEELGLLVPHSRSKGGFRFYRESDLNRLNMIKGLADLGLHLDRIRELMDTRAVGLSRPEFLARVTRALEQQDQLLRERIAAIEDQRKLIQSAQEKLTECRPCEHTPQWANNFCEPCMCDGLRLPEHLSALY